MPPEYDEQGTEGAGQAQPHEDEENLDPTDGGEALDDTGEDGEGGAESDAAPPPPSDRSQQLQDKYDREIADLKAALRNAAEAQRPPRSVVPRAFSIPQDQWTTRDLQEFNQYTIQQEIQRVTAENEWRGKFSAATLGDGYDFDSVTERLYEIPAIANDPTSLHFVRNLDPVNRYMLALVHEVASHAGGDPVRTIQAVRHALGARTAAARDIAHAVNRPQRDTNLNVIRGGRSQAVSRAKNPWDLSEEEFRREVQTRKG
jgi:hypothetical protein